MEKPTLTLHVLIGERHAVDAAILFVLSDGRECENIGLDAFDIDSEGFWDFQEVNWRWRM